MPAQLGMGSSDVQTLETGFKEFRFKTFTFKDRQGLAAGLSKLKPPVCSNVLAEAKAT